MVRHLKDFLRDRLRKIRVFKRMDKWLSVLFFALKQGIPSVWFGTCILIWKYSLIFATIDI